VADHTATPAASACTWGGVGVDRLLPGDPAPEAAIARSIVSALLLLGCARSPGALSEPLGADSIAAAGLRAHVEHLSDDAFAGRETGTPDALRAAEYLRAELTALGLEPLPGDDDLFADYTLHRLGYDPAATRLAVRAGDRELELALGRSWRPFDFSDPGEIDGEVVFAGYGITAAEHDWDDYAGLDVEGRIVLLLRHEPGEDDPDSPFDGVRSSEHASFLKKATNAADHGAIGYLLVTDPMHHEGSDDLRVDGRLVLEPPERTGPGESQGPVFRAAQIDRATAQALVATGGHDLAELQRAVDGGTPPRDLALGPVRARLAIGLRDAPEVVPERNVVAVVRGTDLADEWVVVGAHYDHIGAFSGEGDTVFNGADDNASGTAGMLALARAFATRGEPPRRTVVFMGFSGEEKGLLGSKAWVAANGVGPVVFMLNLDMIGRNPDHGIEIYGDGYGTGMAPVILAAAAEAGLETPKLHDAEYFGASDHDSFYQADVPFLFFFTGRHEDYHQLGDHADKVDYDRMERIVQAAFHILQPIADGEHTPMFVHHVGWMGATLEAARVTAVERDTRGERAGLAVGDVLTAVAGEPVTANTLGPALRAVAPGQVAVLALRRGDEIVEVSVERAKIGYLGIQPGAPSEEEAKALGLVDDVGIKVNGLTEGGPASTSGLRVGDIIVGLDGATVKLRSLRGVLQRIGAGETVMARVVRDGEVVMVDVVLGERPERP
jgi:hypothetical protein